MKPRSCATQPAQEGLPNRRAGSVSCPAHPHHGAPGPAGSVAMKPGLDCDHEARALNTCRSQALLAGKREILPPARALRIRAGAIAPATALHWHQDQPGGQSPRPAPAPPPAGASRPPGRALACVVPGPAGLWGSVPRGRGKRAAFPSAARRGDGTSTASMQGPSPLPLRHTRIRTRRGQSPRPASVPCGRWPALRLHGRSLYDRGS